MYYNLLIEDTVELIKILGDENVRINSDIGILHIDLDLNHVFSNINTTIIDKTISYSINFLEHDKTVSITQFNEDSLRSETNWSCDFLGHTIQRFMKLYSKKSTRKELEQRPIAYELDIEMFKVMKDEKIITTIKSYRVKNSSLSK